MDFVENLVKQYSISENNLTELNKEITKLSNELDTLKEQNLILKEDNENLELFNKLKKEDISEFKKQIKELELLKKKNDETISKLKKEKENLNTEIKKKLTEKNKLKINNIKDLSKSLGYNLYNNNDDDDDFGQENQRDNRGNKNNENNNVINDEKIQKDKEDCEIRFIQLKEKCNKYHNDIEQQKLIRENYKEYINDINQQINTFHELVNISVMDDDGQINNNNNHKEIDEVYKQIDKISNYLIDLDEIMFNIKKIFGNNMENLLDNIQRNLINIDKGEYKEDEILKSIITEIRHQIEEIENICFIIEESSKSFYDINKDIEKVVNILNSKLDKINIKQNNQRNEENNYNYINDNDNDNNINNLDLQIGQSCLIGVKKKNFNSILLFENREEDAIENYIDEPKLIRKKWHEICYVYDDYDIYDIYYDVKAVGLSGNRYFPTCSHGFNYNTKIEIESLTVNGIQANYRYNDYSIEFKINLYNLKTAKVHLRYKESKILSLLSAGEREERKIYRYEYYGLSRSLAGQIAKFSLILKGTFDIVNFKEYFLIKNTDNLNEIEYSWGGVVPPDGKRTCLMFSKNKANISFYATVNIYSNHNIKNTSLFIPILFVGGNNEILNIKVSSPQTNNIILDEEKRQYVIQYRNIRDNNGDLIIEGKLENKCKGEWLVDLTDEEIDRMIPQEDKLCKTQLYEIARKIIEDFDRKNKNKDFVFLDYMKIALWVKENIKYDLNYSGRTEYSAIDIYRMKVGVCHHFTVLSNALLYALGYKVIYISGFVVKNNKEFDENSGHAWSLIKVKDKWYPFDSTWGIITGKLPVGHVFQCFFGKSTSLRGFDSSKFGRSTIRGVFFR